MHLFNSGCACPPRGRPSGSGARGAIMGYGLSCDITKPRFFVSSLSLNFRWSLSQGRGGSRLAGKCSPPNQPGRQRICSRPPASLVVCDCLGRGCCRHRSCRPASLVCDRLSRGCCRPASLVVCDCLGRGVLPPSQSGVRLTWRGVVLP